MLEFSCFMYFFTLSSGTEVWSETNHLTVNLTVLKTFLVYSCNRAGKNIPLFRPILY